jgi:hypothetical protein
LLSCGGKKAHRIYEKNRVKDTILKNFISNTFKKDKHPIKHCRVLHLLNG